MQKYKLNQNILCLVIKFRDKCAGLAVKHGVRGGLGIQGEWQGFLTQR